MGTKKAKFVTSTPAVPKKKEASSTSPPESSTESRDPVNALASDSGIEDDKTKFAARKSNTPFRRVDLYGDIEVAKKLSDNSFESKAGFDAYGAKASQDLIVTKGKSFRHEKTKKKRGSYKGGAISCGVASIKFDSD